MKLLPRVQGEQGNWLHGELFILERVLSRPLRKIPDNIYLRNGVLAAFALAVVCSLLAN